MTQLPPRSIGPSDSVPPRMPGGFAASTSRQTLPFVTAPVSDRAVQLPELKALGLTPQERLQVESLQKAMMEALPSHPSQGDLSFASLWTADRLGGPSLQSQRSSVGTSAPHDETPDGLISAGLSICRSGLIPGLDPAPLESAWSLIELGQTWKANSPRLALRRAPSLLTGPSGWRAEVDRCWEEYSSRGAPSQSLEDLWSEAPVDAPLPFSILTDSSVSHRVYAIRREVDGKPALELWNVGWGSLKGPPGPRGDPQVFPAGRFVFANEADAGRGLVALMDAERFYYKDRPINALLATLTLPQQRDLLASKTPDALLQLAQERQTLLFPAEPVKPQRSGSCVAKSLRAWLQEQCGGSQNPQSRLIMAALDGCALSLMAREHPGQPAELNQLRQMLARLHADYRWLKAQRESISPEERLLRAAALVPAQIRPTPSPIYQQTFSGSAAAPAAIELERISPHASEPAQRSLVDYCRDLTEALGNPEELQKKIQDYQRGLSYSVQADLRKRSEECLQGWSPLTPLQLEFIALRYLTPLWSILQSTVSPVAQVGPSGTQTFATAELYDPFNRICTKMAHLLRGSISLLPRPGADLQRWAAANDILDAIPMPHHWIPMPQSPGELEEQRSLFEEDLHLRFTRWLKAKNLTTALNLPDDWLAASPHQSARQPMVSWSLKDRITLHRKEQLSALQQNDPALGHQLELWSAMLDRCLDLRDLIAKMQTSNPFEARRAAAPLSERPLLIRRSIRTQQYGRYSSNPLDFAAEIRSVSNGLSMDTPGLAGLLIGAAEVRAPFLGLSQIAAWTPPLGVDGIRVNPQGNLIALAGHEAWNRWLDCALDEHRSFGQDRGESNARRLRALTVALLEGLPVELNDADKRTLRKLDSLLDMVLPEHPTLALPLAMVRLTLLFSDAKRPLPPTATILGSAATPLVRVYTQADWPILQRIGSQWLQRRREDGLPSPEIVEIAGPDGRSCRLDLEKGTLQGKSPVGRAESHLASLRHPPEWQKVRNQQGQTRLQWLPGSRQTIALDPWDPDHFHGYLQATWTSAISGERMSALLWNPPADRQGYIAVLKWEDDETIQQAPLPLQPGTVLWSGSLPPSERGAQQLQQELNALPGIFQRSPLVIAGDGTRSYGLIVPGTLQERARLEHQGTDLEVRFPDDERIRLDTTWTEAGCVAIGSSATQRLMLRDVAQQGEPIRGRIVGKDLDLRIELDNGWQIAPGQRHRLPTWLQDLPSGQDQARTLALPVVRAGAMGLLIGSPVQSEGAGLGEAIFLTVTQSEDIELDPSVNLRSVIALLPHLAAWAPLVAQRVMSALASSPHRLSPLEKKEFSETLATLKIEPGLLVGPFVQQVHQPGEPLSVAGDLLAMRALPEIQDPYPELVRSLASSERDELLKRLHEGQAAFESQDVEGVIQSLQQLQTDLEAIEHTDQQKLHEVLAADSAPGERTERAGLSTAQRAYLAAGPGSLLLTTLIHTWVQAEQQGSLDPWRLQFGVLSPSTISQLHHRLRPLVANKMLGRQVERVLLLAQRLREAEHQEGHQDEVADRQIGQLRKELLSELTSLEARLKEQLPSSLLRQEWLFGLVGRPVQLEHLKEWKGVIAQTPHSRQLRVVRMGGGKTSLLNPSIALELAHQSKVRHPENPEPVFLVVPDNLEEDVRDLCSRQGWQLMGSPLPFEGSQCNLDELLKRSREAAQRGLPLTLTQSAWNFAWLEALDRAFKGVHQKGVNQAELKQGSTKKISPRGQSPRAESAGTSGAPSSTQNSAEALRYLSRAALLLDEADEALSLDQSFNLQTQSARPLPAFLLKALGIFLAERMHQQRSAQEMPSPAEQEQWLRLAAPPEWPADFTNQVIEALINHTPLPPGAEQSTEPSATDSLAAMGLILGAYPTLQGLRWGIDYGPSSDSSLDLVPYQSAHWPSDQTFSHPAVLGLLTLIQSEQPEFWTLLRAQTLSQLLIDLLSGDTALADTLGQRGLENQDRFDPQQLQKRLCHPDHLALRQQIGLLLCSTHAKTSDRALRLDASGAPLRAKSAVAMTGTAPSESGTPTSLWTPEIGAQIPSSLLQSAEFTTANGFDEIVERLSPDILIDPNGLLDADQAAKLAYDMAQQRRKAGPQGDQPPVALTWSAGTSRSAPRLQQVLPSGALETAPPPEALSLRPKCVVYQQAQCRGTDLRPSEGERGVLFLQQPIPLRDLLQAAARLRGLVAGPGQKPLQTLTIALSPTLGQQLIDSEPGQSPLEALLALCQKEQEQHDAALAPELLRQDLKSMEQAAGVLLLARWDDLSERQRRDLQPRMSAIEEAFSTQFRYPKLGELVQPEEQRSPKREIERLLQRAEQLQDLLRGYSHLEVIGAGSDGEPAPTSAIRDLEEQLILWRTRLDALASMVTSPAANLSSDALHTQQTAMTQTSVVRQQQGVGQEQSQEQAIELQIEESTQILRQYCTKSSREEAARLVCYVSMTEDGGWQGAQSSGLTVQQGGISGFDLYWQSRGGSPSDFLVPAGLPVSEAALRPYDRDCAPEDPLRLEPYLLHRKENQHWSALVCSPQEAAMMLDHPQWKQQVEKGSLLITSLAGHALSGAWMCSPEGEREVQNALQSGEWRQHQLALVQQTGPLRAFFGVSLSSVPEQREAQLQWLRSHPRWQEVWLMMASSRNRPRMIATLL